jgi:stage II sporulation protein D
MVIGGTTYKGTTLRQKLGLRSTAFTMTAVGDHITVTTRGYGHRVGMSQYGAEAMAAQGSTYEQILRHYYKGTELLNWIDNMENLG